MNFNMHGMVKSVMELHGMLKTAEENIQQVKPNPVMLVQKGQNKKKRGKAKAKSGDVKSSGSEAKASNRPKAKRPKLNESERTCFHCNKVGHWRVNCELFKEEQKKNGAKASTSGINDTELISISTALVLFYLWMF